MHPNPSSRPTGSAIHQDKVRAYHETEYWVDPPAALVLRIGEKCQALAQLHTNHGVVESAFLTACNPCGQELSDAENATRQQTLVDEVCRHGLTVITGAGKHPSNGWPPEPSVLVLGLGLDQARELGKAWQQDAIVWAGADAVPQLILLR